MATSTTSAAASAGGALGARAAGGSAGTSCVAASSPGTSCWFSYAVITCALASSLSQVNGKLAGWLVCR